MQIVELGDNTMVIMKDSCDPPWISVGSVYREASKYKYNIEVRSSLNLRIVHIFDNYIYSAGRLVLFSEKEINPEFNLYDTVKLSCVFR